MWSWAVYRLIRANLIFDQKDVYLDLKLDSRASTSFSIRTSVSAFFVHFFPDFMASSPVCMDSKQKKVSTLETIHFLSTKDCTLYLLTVWNSFEVCPLYYWKNKGINWMAGAIKSTINLIFWHQLKVLPLLPPTLCSIHTFVFKDNCALKYYPFPPSGGQPVALIQPQVGKLTWSAARTGRSHCGKGRRRKQRCVCEFCYLSKWILFSAIMPLLYLYYFIHMQQSLFIWLSCYV